MTPAGTNFERVETYGRPVPPETQSRNLLQQFGNGLKNIFKPASRRRLPHHVSAPEWNGSFSETGVQPLAQYKRIPLSWKTALYGGYRGDCVKSCGDSCGKSCEKSCGTSNGNSNGTCDGACGSTCGNCDGEPEGRSCVKHFEKCHDHLRKCLECKFGYFCHQGCCGKGCPHYGSYEMLYSAKPDYFDPRDGRLYSAQGFGMPVAVPLAPNVTNQYNYGWGIPSSRLTPISTIIPQLP